MKIRKLYKTFSIIASMLILLLCGCMDLGNFESEDGDYSDYYNAFSDVTLVNKDKDSSIYTIKNSFFNDTTVNDMEWEDSAYEVTTDEYMYMYLQVQRDLIVLDDFAMYVKGESGANIERLSIDMYIVNSLPDFTKVKPYDYEGDGTGTEDVAETDKVASIACSVGPNNWNSFKFGKFYTDDTQYSTKLVYKDQYIVLKFVNNTYEGTEQDPQLNNVKFTLINLLIRDKGN